MKFKEARKLGRSITNDKRIHWVYLYQTKNREWCVSDCENFQSDCWYYLHRDGRILNHILYENWERIAQFSSSKYPFSRSIPKELYNKKGNSKNG